MCQYGGLRFLGKVPVEHYVGRWLPEACSVIDEASGVRLKKIKINSKLKCDSNLKLTTDADVLHLNTNAR